MKRTIIYSQTTFVCSQLPHHIQNAHGGWRADHRFVAAERFRRLIARVTRCRCGNSKRRGSCRRATPVVGWLDGFVEWWRCVCGCFLCGCECRLVYVFIVHVDTMFDCVYKCRAQKWMDGQECVWIVAILIYWNIHKLWIYKQNINKIYKQNLWSGAGSVTVYRLNHLNYDYIRLCENRVDGGLGGNIARILRKYLL